MKRILYASLIFFISVTSILAAKNSVPLDEVSKNVFELKSGKIVMKISSKGGRIVSFRFEEKEMLTQQNESVIYGSTLWTSPQSGWGWPPFDVLDNQDYSVEWNGGTLKMISNPDSKSGFQFEKSWKVNNDHSIQIEYLIRNITNSSKSVGAWEVTRVPCGGLVFFPEGSNEKLPESALKPDLDQEGVQWVLIDRKPISEHQKLFATAQEGWLAYSLNGLLFIKKFPDTKPEDYAPEQGEVEVFINKDKSYTELENQGAYCLLNPGETIKYKVTWELVPIPETVKNEVGSQQLVNFTKKQINEQ